MLPAAAILFALGLAALILGLRGRRLDDPPICRLCRFDLSGIYPAPLCPECGAGLQATRGRTPVILGHRKRRWTFIVPGLMLALIGGAATWALLSGWASGIDWMPYKPTWLVAQEAAVASPSRAAPALRELTDRISDNRVSTSQLSRLADRALSVQADSTVPWSSSPRDPSWSAIFESAWTANAVSRQQLIRFAHQAIVARLAAPASVARGHLCAIGPEFVERRTVPARRLGYHVQLIRLVVGGKTLHDQAPDPGRTAAGGAGLGSGGSPWVPMIEAFAIDAPEGEHEVEAVYQFWIFDGWGASPLIDSWPVTLRGKISVLPADTQVTRQVIQEPLRAAVAGAIKVRTPIRNIIDAGGQFTWGAIDIHNPPIAVAFDIFLRAGGREWPLGSVAARPGESTTENLGGREWPLTGLSAPAADIILRPNPAAAERHLPALTPEIWGEEVILRDLPIQEVRQGSPR